ncbi:MAG: glycosyltransferase family 39 protein [Acidobacteria bacterium]|nr:glycosyltransferase family 39 protein [Acidobacteriota bacterium]
MVSRWPLMPAHLYSFDSVNLALALEDFDPTKNQPQPPGYPLFVLEAKLFHLLLGTPERTFAILSILICGLSLGVLYLLGRRMFSPWVGLLAAALLFVNPPFWFSGLTSALRPHLALIATLLAYFCWRAVSGEPRYFLAASLTLGFGSGFRPELLALLLPLWVWTAWSVGDRKLFLQGCALVAVPALVGGLVLVEISGGMAGVLPTFFGYLFSQAQQTSVFLDPRASSWLRWAGRAVLWNALGVLPWLWALPFGWVQRRQWPQWQSRLAFLAVWFFPVFLFHLMVHIGDPDQALSSIAALCLLGGYCLAEADQLICRRWLPGLLERGLLVWVALLGNLLFFFAHITLPQRDPQAAGFRGLESVTDAISFGTYESSYARVLWVEQMAGLALKEIQNLKANTDRPILLLWARDGEPVWRRIAFYFPSERIYVLEQSGDPAVLTTSAQLWTGSQKLSQFGGDPPIPVPVPSEARLVWVVGSALVESLQQAVPLQAAPPLYYTDLSAQLLPFRWRSFEFVPQ